MDDYPELNSLLSMVQQNDTHKKMMASEELKKYLSNPLSPLTADAIDCLVDNFKIWINSGNYKISASGLELFTILIRRGGKSVKLNLNKVVPIIIDRLGDSKAVVRENSRSFLQELMHSFTPQVVLDLLIPAFSHKGFKVREEVMTCFMDSINVFGVTNLSISKFTPHICKLLGDANSQVRDNAIRTLVEIYRHVGEKVRIDLSKRGIPPTRLSLINSKFDEVLKSGTMIASATDGPPKANGDVQEPVKRREASVKLKKSNLRNEAKSEGSSTSGLAAGAVDENDFLRAYTDTPTVQIGSARELSDALTKISNALSSPSDDWEEHVAALKRVRSLVDGGSLDFDFMTQLKPLEGAFNAAVKSLRSAVAREACVTLSYLATKLGNKFGPVVDCILPTVIDLNANTATKVMASSGDTCAKIIIKNTHYPRLILHITTRMASRSTPVRIRCADYVVLLLEYWELHYLKSHVDELEKVVRNGLSDASSDVRAIIRKAFWQFSKLFKDKADKMFNDLDRSKQKLLEVDKKSSDIDHTVEKSTSSSRGSIRTRPTSATSRVTRTDVVTNNKPTRLNSREASPGRRALPGKKNNSSTPSRMVARSVSSVDARAAERARMRRRSRTEDAVKPSNYAPSDVRPRPSRSSSKVVHRGYMSQPASRSTSPSRLHFMFSPKERSNVYSTMASPLRSKIPTPNSRSASRCNSRASSRDPSPTRDRGLRSFSSSSLHGRKPSHVRRLDAKDFTEAAVWDALSKSPRPRNYSFNSTCSEEQDEGSDTSSVHSDRSSSVMTTLETAKKLILNHLKKVDNDPRAYISKSDVSNAKPPSSPGRLGYRSIPLAAPRHSSNGDDPVASVDVVSNALSPLQREDSATSLRSNESSESLEGKKACGNPPENSPSITSSGYHSDEIHTNDTVINNSSRHVLHSEPKLPTSPSFSVSKNTEYDASRYQDETSRVSTDSSVNGVDTVQDNVTVSLSNESSDTFNKAIHDDVESIRQLLLILLSDTNIDVKRNALTDLLKMARESSPSLWESQFKDILMSVIDKMKDPDLSFNQSSCSASYP
ncbi:CLIP-associating protein 1-like isoform X2 [Xenia sp. Carnegie-2017]|uniref:CLIP-associating protein 1-like isoform X2 n=1 Tax=Xenia sp. Carnegie-2017 TaxID=2897299 RepID=UPI001F0422B7|nr:CLIP-associating protein 1-like isoform X2 [Xenia sp. Carnegie-2017]